MSDKKLNTRRWLDGLLAGSLFLAYLLYLTNDYFLGWSPLKGRVLFWLIFGLFLVGVAIRIYITYPVSLAKFLALARKQAILNWPWLALLAALILGGWLRWQTIQKPPELTERERDFAASAINIVKRSDWKPPNFSQPPLYLYTNALFAEGLSIQSAGKPGAVSIDDLKPETYLTAFRYLNLALGLLTLVPIFAAGNLLFGRRAGAIAALLFATAWISYRATSLLVLQTLAGLLAAVAFYLIIRQWRGNRLAEQPLTKSGSRENLLVEQCPTENVSSTKNISASILIENKGASWNWFWIGATCGLAAGAAYGAILLFVPLLLAVWWNGERRGRKLGIAILGWLLAFTIAVSGWLLNLPAFLNGLASIGSAPPNAPKFYLKELATHDAGLLLSFALALLLTLLNFGATIKISVFPNLIQNSKFKIQNWLLLAFPLLYSGALLLVGPLEGARLAVIAPFLALSAAYPIEWAAQLMARKLDDARHRWAGAATALGLTVFIIVLGVLVRRFFNS